MTRSNMDYNFDEKALMTRHTQNPKIQIKINK